MRKLIQPAALIAFLAFTATTLGGESDRRQVAGYELTASKPGAATGQHFAVDYVNPDDPQGKPPAVRRVVIVLPRGARYDTGAPRQCTASDAELMAQGAAACPAGSKVGEGVITVDSGIPGPLRFVVSDTTFFNNQDELIYLNTVRGTGARVVVRGTVKPRRVITESPFLPGAPPDGAAIDTVDVTFPVTKSKRGNYITTPPHCPARRYWRMRAKFTYADGVTQVERDRSRCQQ